MNYNNPLLADRINPRALFRGIARRLLRLLRTEPLARPPTDNKVGQLLLNRDYAAAVAAGTVPSIYEVGFRQYSQFEEDGILLFLCAVIRPKRKVVLELCCGIGSESNTANLIVNHGWSGVLVDGNPGNAVRTAEFYRNNPDTFYFQPVVCCDWITAENVNEIVKNAGLSGEIGLLSLDMDGMDYWIFRALSVVNPEILVCEVNPCIPPSETVTIPYQPNFKRSDEYFGASLSAMTILAAKKNYRLVGTNRYGINAFFVRRDVAKDELPEYTPDQCFQRSDCAQRSANKNWSALSRRDWVKIA